DETVGHGLAHDDARHALHEFAQAFEMLNVHRPDHVDAGVQKREHVLETFAVAAAGHVGVRDLVDDRHGRLSREHAVEIHLFDGDASVLRSRARYDLQPWDERFRFAAPVRLDIADHDVDAALLERVRFFEHAIRLADARREPEVELEPAPFGALDEL